MCMCVVMSVFIVGAIFLICKKNIQLAHRRGVCNKDNGCVCEGVRREKVRSDEREER